MNTNALLFVSPRQRMLLALAVAAVASAALLALLPSDVLAAVGGGGSATDSAKNFKKNGLDSTKAVGVVVFACVAMFAIARGTIGGKTGQGIAAFAVACLGMSVTLSPEAVMSGIGGWVTGMFES